MQLLMMDWCVGLASYGSISLHITLFQQPQEVMEFYLRFPVHEVIISI